MYICWLCSAVFCHLPSFEALGLDMKADVSLGLSIAASSLLVGVVKGPGGGGVGRGGSAAHFHVEVVSG